MRGTGLRSVQAGLSWAHFNTEMATTTIPASRAATFSAIGPRRSLLFGGIALIVAGMLFGDIFAVFVLHQNGGQTGRALFGAAHAVAAQDSLGVKAAFVQMGDLLEDRGTKVDAHVHMIDAGYLALLLALIQPYVALSPARKQMLARLFLTGGLLLPVGIFLIHYAGLAYSPFPVIGWASILADSAGALLIIVLLVEGWGFWKYLRDRRAGPVEPELPKDRTWERRVLLSGGTMLILIGFVYGAWYAGANLYEHENREIVILKDLLDQPAGEGGVSASVNAYGMLQAEKAVQIASHSHIIEFGLLAILLSFVQPFVYLSERWKRIWVAVLLSGSVILPIFVLLELKLGLLAGGIADAGGLMVVVGLVGMLVGIVRHTGSLDAKTGETR
jgi:hypothetical protein